MLTENPEENRVVSPDSTKVKRPEIWDETGVVTDELWAALLELPVSAPRVVVLQLPPRSR